MEEKDVQRLIDMLYNMIDEAKSAAFSAEKCTINRDEALDILDEMRSKLPLELKKAKELIAARNDYVAGAKKEVEKMMRQAELDAKTKVSDSEVLYAAKEKARQMVARAEERGRQPVIVGTPDHPEVLAIAGWCRAPAVVSGAQELEKWLSERPERRSQPLTFVSQTTSTQKIWNGCVKKAKKECTNAEFFDTICGATSKRQEEAVQLAAQCGVSPAELHEMLRILLKEEEPHV